MADAGEFFQNWRKKKQMIIKAIRHNAISILIYILMHPFIERVCENYGVYSIQHWIIVLLSFAIGTTVMYLVIKLEEN